MDVLIKPSVSKEFPAADNNGSVTPSNSNDFELVFEGLFLGRTTPVNLHSRLEPSRHDPINDLVKPKLSDIRGILCNQEDALDRATEFSTNFKIEDLIVEIQDSVGFALDVGASKKELADIFRNYATDCSRAFELLVPHMDGMGVNLRFATSLRDQDIIRRDDVIVVLADSKFSRVIEQMHQLLGPIARVYGLAVMFNSIGDDLDPPYAGG